jgi:hypothetical protein
LSRNHTVCSPHWSTVKPAEVKKEIELEIAHVLFIDIMAENVLLTPALLRLDPIRNDPRFQKLAQSEAPKQ